MKSARLQGEPPTDSGLHSDMGELSIAHTRSGRPHNPILASATLSEANHCLEALAAGQKTTLAGWFSPLAGGGRRRTLPAGRSSKDLLTYRELDRGTLSIRVFKIMGTCPSPTLTTDR